MEGDAVEVAAVEGEEEAGEAGGVAEVAVAVVVVEQGAAMAVAVVEGAR